jgi:hypothetical protein
VLGRSSSRRKKRRRRTQEGRVKKSQIFEEIQGDRLGPNSIPEDFFLATTYFMTTMKGRESLSMAQEATVGRILWHILWICSEEAKFMGCNGLGNRRERTLATGYNS